MPTPEGGIIEEKAPDEKIKHQEDSMCLMLMKKPAGIPKIGIPAGLRSAARVGRARRARQQR
jgi:hypothetical protein